MNVGTENNKLLKKSVLHAQTCVQSLLFSAPISELYSSLHYYCLRTVSTSTAKAAGGNKELPRSFNTPAGQCEC